MNNLELATLLETISNNMPKIQSLFKQYQNKHFPLRIPQFFCLELNGEAGELANLEKKLWKGKGIEESELAEESADIFIALMNYLNSRNLDFTSALIKKLKWIENRRLELSNEGEEY